MRGEEKLVERIIRLSLQKLIIYTGKQTFLGTSLVLVLIPFLFQRQIFHPVHTWRQRASQLIQSQVDTALDESKQPRRHGAIQSQAPRRSETHVSTGHVKCDDSRTCIEAQPADKSERGADVHS